MTQRMPSFFRARSALAQDIDSGPHVKFDSQIVSKHEILFSTKEIAREGLDFMVAEN